ncbi:MAG: hypothetical protein WAO61_03030 [Solirubrobacterales bacterium]
MTFVVGVLAVVAVAKDTHAPAKAGDRWLPCENWAMFHWIPFNERHLYALTGIKRWQFKRWIRDDDRHTLAKLIRRRGKDPDVIVQKLMAQWRGKVDTAQFAELQRRAGELMTQGHLSQHVFFHYFHNPAIALNSKYIFGVRSPDYMAARRHAFTPREIARAGGRSGRTVIRRTFKVLRDYADRGVRLKQVSRRQANFFIRQQRQWLEIWWDQRIGRRDITGFPRGTPARKRRRATATCGYFAGSNHVPGPHEDH